MAWAEGYLGDAGDESVMTEVSDVVMADRGEGRDVRPDAHDDRS